MADNEITRQKLKTSEFKDIKLEKLIIAGILKHKEVLWKCSKEVSSDYFSSDRCKFIYETIMSFYNSQNSVMTTQAFEIILDTKTKEEKLSYLKLWKSIVKYKRESDSAACLAAIQKLINMYHCRLIEQNIDTTIRGLKNILQNGYGTVDKLRDEYSKIVPKLEIRPVVATVTDPFEKYQEFKANHLAIQKDPSLIKSVPTGIEELDKVMGGLRSSEFGLITAGTGVGKSILMLDFAYHCYEQVGDVLYITIEMPENQVRERFYCRLSGIEYGNFRQYSLDSDHWKRLDHKIANLQENNEYKFKIIDMPRSCTVEQLRIEIEEFIRKNFQPRLIVIDYLNILQGGFDWSAQLENAVGIKQQIARYFKIATWSANQLMGAKHDKEKVGISDMAFAKNITDNVDIGLGLGLTDLTEEEGIFNMSFLKTRDFAGKSFRLYGDRSRMTFTKKMEKQEDREEKKFKKKEIGAKVKT